MGSEPFGAMLAGGHPNSLGRTVEVVECVLDDPARLDELLACYGSGDDVVRLRTSNALKRIGAERHDWLVPCIPFLLTHVAALDQPSAQWTLAQLFDRLSGDMSAEQRAAAEAILRRNLSEAGDWIVLNTTMDTLASWAITVPAGVDPTLRDWLAPHLDRLAGDARKSVAKRAAGHRARLAAD